MAISSGPGSSEFRKPLPADADLEDDISKYFSDGEISSPLDDVSETPSIDRIRARRKAPKGKNNKRSLYLLLLLLLILGFWWWAATRNNFSPPVFSEPTVKNPIRVTTLDLSTSALDVSEIDAADLPRVEVDTTKIGQGQFYLSIDECAFSECVANYQDIFQQANLPFSKRTSKKFYKFVELTSTQSFPETTLAGDDRLDFVRKLLSSDLNVSKVSAERGRNKISIGLFTTLQNAKDTKEMIEMKALEDKLALNFNLNQVTVSQDVTKIYSGPYLDSDTAKKIITELAITTPIKTANIVKLTN